MLVVISDLHINDGTTCIASDVNASKVFFTELEDQVQAAGVRDGYYKAVESIDIVLLGDIFDLIRTDRWTTNKDGTKHKIRPWDHVEQYAPIVENITRDICGVNALFLQPFKDASKNGLEIKNPETGEVDICKVNIYYMVGNHDWFLYHKSPLLDKTRELVNEAFGINQKEFPWLIEENNDTAKAIHQSCLAHRTYLQHGDKYDAMNYHKFFGRDHSSLGDAVVIELINSFPQEVVDAIKKKYPDDEISPEFYKALDELDNVRPATHTAIYIRNIIKTLTPNRHKKIVTDTFNKCTKRAQNSGIFKKVFPYDPMPILQLKAIQIADVISPTPLVRAVVSMVDLMSSTQEKKAPKEDYVKNGLCDYVVYGHTHEYSSPIGIGMENSKPKIYINSSTWRPMHLEITNDPTVKTFPYFTTKNMVWVGFYKEGERAGRKYEIWSGNLGV